MPALTEALDEPLAKAYRCGTHRMLAPSETLARVRPCASRMGITLLSDVTGLDRIGIPVAVAVRPNSRSVSVSQGKGLDLTQAMASALMEASESFHAEELRDCRLAAYHELASEELVVEPAELCPDSRRFDAGASISWVQGYDLLQRKACWVPAEIVHTDHTLPRDGYFRTDTNGLASGNHLIEAVGSAICELVERDAVAVWNAFGMLMRARRGLDMASIDDPACRALCAKYAKAGIVVRIWDVTSDIGIAAFFCAIREVSEGEPRRLRRFHGAGCHPDRAVALARALTEAAQTRLTYITGIRDDISLSEYEELHTAEIEKVKIWEALFDALRQQGEQVSFQKVPSFAADDLGQDLQWELGRLRAVGIRSVIAVNLTQADFEIPVVRVVIPGLEGDPRHPNYSPGPRAQRAAARSQ